LSQICKISFILSLSTSPATGLLQKPSTKFSFWT
jgi:hypothetical protein